MKILEKNKTTVTIVQHTDGYKYERRKIDNDIYWYQGTTAMPFNMSNELQKAYKEANNIFKQKTQS